MKSLALYPEFFDKKAYITKINGVEQEHGQFGYSSPEERGHYKGKPIASGNYLAMYSVPMKIYYYLCLCPFKITYNDNSNVNETDSPQMIQLSLTKWAKIRCVIFYIFTTAFIIIVWKVAWAEETIGHFAIDITSQLQVLSFAHFVWIRQTEFLKFLQSVAFYPLKRPLLKIYSFIFAYLILSVYIITSINLNVYKRIWETRQQFIESIFIISPANDIGAMVISGCYILLDIFKNVLYGCNDSLILMIGYTVHHMSRDFERLTIEKVPSKIILQKFEAMKDMANNANQAFGLMLLANYICVIPYYADFLKMLITPDESLIGKLNIFPFVVWNAAGWGFVANFNLQMNRSMKSWLYKNYNNCHLHSEHLVVITAEVYSTNAMGLGCQFFTVTYGLLGTMLGLILTYAVVIFQMRTSPP